MTLFWRLRRNLVCIFVTSLAIAPASAGVDLHAHLFMHEGAGTSLLGSFRGALRAEAWNDRIFSRVNVETLEQSGANLVVVALYSHPFFLKRQRSSIRTQVREAQEFVRAHPHWALARSAEEAAQALSDKKRVLILSLEGMDGVIESEVDVREFIDGLGIRIVTPMHFMDSAHGGAAFMPGFQIVINPWAAFKSFFSPVRDDLEVRVNPKGLTASGRELILSLLRRGVWIDLTHASDALQTDLMPLLTAAGQPPLYTHTVVRTANRAERGISLTQLERVRASQGIVGVLPSDDMLRGTTVAPQFCSTVCSSGCHGGLAAFLTQFSDVADVIGFRHTLIGTDIDAPLTFLQPGCENASKAEPRGIWNYAQLPQILEALKTHQLAEPDQMATHFTAVWRRVRPWVPR